MLTTYKNHVIVAAGVLDDFTYKYASIASISWKAEEKRGVHVLDCSPQRFLSQDEARNFALSMAQNWIDAQPGHVKAGIIAPTLSRVVGE
jgi:hypothetical protein